MGQYNKIKSLNWGEIQSFYDTGGTWRDIMERYDISSATVGRAVKLGLLTTKKRYVGGKGRKQTEATKQKIREARIKFLHENPSHKLWGSGRRHYDSAASKSVKKFLEERGAVFVEEFQPLLELKRFYSIDIAFPDKKIGLEINGGQHYETDGNLKPYYQNRHDLIQSTGWKLIEIPYSYCFNYDFLHSVYDKVMGVKPILDFDYIAYQSKPKTLTGSLRNVCVCGKAVSRTAKACRKCASKARGLRFRKVDRPTKEALVGLVEAHSFAAIGRMFGVRDNTVRKWCSSYGIVWKK